MGPMTVTARGPIDGRGRCKLWREDEMASYSSNGRDSPAPGIARRISCPDGTRPRILLAEDSDTARFLTAALLKKMGCEVDAVEHGEEALYEALRRSYDIIVLDIEMPVMDGVAAARAIRASGGAAAATPIMALSAFLADTAKVCSLRDEFDLTLAKPAGREELYTAFATILHRPQH